jgi:hypothetical protein
MNLRVLRSDSQGRWKEGQPSWDLTHHKRKQSRNQPPDETPAAEQTEAAVYNAKGDLVMPVSSLEIDI